MQTAAAGECRSRLYNNTTQNSRAYLMTSFSYVRHMYAALWHLTLPQSLTLLLTQRTMGMPRGVLLGTVESCVEKLAE